METWTSAAEFDGFVHERCYLVQVFFLGGQPGDEVEGVQESGSSRQGLHLQSQIGAETDALDAGAQQTMGHSRCVLESHHSW